MAAAQRYLSVPRYISPQPALENPHTTLHLHHTPHPPPNPLSSPYCVVVNKSVFLGGHAQAAKRQGS